MPLSLSTPMTDADWKERLTPEQYRVLREKGTERAFVGALVHETGRGVYRCAGCATPLFTSEDKFESGSGWPSFTDVVAQGTVTLRDDRSHNMHRIEVACATCGGHLGHLFDDGPPAAGGLRYCVNSVALDFDGAAPPEAAREGGAATR